MWLVFLKYLVLIYDVLSLLLCSHYFSMHKQVAVQSIFYTSWYGSSSVFSISLTVAIIPCLTNEYHSSCICKRISRSFPYKLFSISQCLLFVHVFYYVRRSALCVSIQWAQSSHLNLITLLIPGLACFRWKELFERIHEEEMSQVSSFQEIHLQGSF